ncbi:MAG: helix-turn-helix domain-containing protein [Aigarchaeota archaeon]|nr:helix-turn-helix domain-containing protein [Candidatus Pelearchaeum maunauluense]
MVEIEPRAFLRRMRNTRRGVSSRTRILKAVREGEKSIDEISSRSGLSVAAVRYHLENLRREGVVERIKSGKRARWRLTGIGQRTIEEASQA